MIVVFHHCGLSIISNMEFLYSWVTNYLYRPTRKYTYQIIFIIFVFQGVWVFIIFVCKRNVLRVLQGKSRNLYNSLAKSLSRNMSSKFQAKDMLTIVLSIPVPMRTTVSEMSQASRTDATSMSMSDSSPADSNGDPLLSKN